MLSMESFGFGQKNPAFLVPFNNKGKWTWSDTLGKRLNCTHFDSTGFFFEHIVKGKKEQIAEVIFKGKKNYYFNKKLMFPKSYSLVEEINLKEKSKESIYVLKNKAGKVGLYSTSTHSFLTECIYERLVFKSQQQDQLYFQKEGSKLLSVFNLQTNKIGRSDYISLELIAESLSEDDFTNFRIHEIATKSNGVLVERIGDLEYPIDLSKINNWKSNFNEMNEIHLTENLIDFDTKSIKPNELKNGDIFNMECRKNDYNYKELKVVYLDGKFGCVNQNDSVILPCIYDRLIIKEQHKYIETSIGSKHGLKLLFTHYPTIEAIYDTIELTTQFEVNENWSFILYYATKGNQAGFVGENGVEYFR